MDDSQFEKNQQLQGRSYELQEWDKNRKAELFLDLWAHFWRCSAGLVVAVSIWQLLNYLKLSDMSGWRFALFYSCAAYIARTVIVWLRLWGSYIERRLEEMEARINGDWPSCYAKEAPDRVFRNGLHERLQQIESSIEQLRP
jgi:hypothetical protein